MTELTYQRRQNVLDLIGPLKDVDKVTTNDLTKIDKKLAGAYDQVDELITEVKNLRESMNKILDEKTVKVHYRDYGWIYVKNAEESILKLFERNEELEALREKSDRELTSHKMGIKALKQLVDKREEELSNLARISPWKDSTSDSIEAAREVVRYITHTL
jgi:DNA repair exonuclease SbcCD ATPase subunit